jgi:predicted MFS family arabinose efflux permease
MKSTWSDAPLLPLGVVVSVSLAAYFGAHVGLLVGWAMLFLMAAAGNSVLLVLGRMRWPGYSYPRSYRALGHEVVTRDEEEDRRTICMWLAYAARCIVVAMVL